MRRNHLSFGDEEKMEDITKVSICILFGIMLMIVLIKSFDTPEPPVVETHECPEYHCPIIYRCNPDTLTEQCLKLMNDGETLIGIGE